MDEPGEEFEPLFDYSRVQPTGFANLDEDFDDSSPIFSRRKRKRICDRVERKGKETGEVVVVLDDDDEGGKEKDEEDWLPPPPPKLPNIGSGIEENNTIRELRLKKQELASLAQSAEDVLRSVTESARRDFRNSEKSALESKGGQPSKQVDREKIIISIQDKDGQKQFRMYMDDKFERLFRMYADKVKLKLDELVFSFDGDKVSPTATPEGLGLENDDMIEVHIKS